MRWFMKQCSSVNRKRLKIAMMVGLGAGILVVASFSEGTPPASGKEFTTLSELAGGLRSLRSLLPQEASDAQGKKAPAAEAEELFEPADFLDASFELMAAVSTADDAHPTVTLESGEQLTFTILPRLQRAVEEQYRRFQPEEAAFVALDPRTGAVLTLTGYLDGQITPHRALMADGPAASVFKIVTAAALVEQKRVRPARQVCYHGGRQGITRRHLTADPERDNICLSLSQAMGKSANVVFARLAHEKLSGTELATYAERFGFNQPIPFPWPVELSKAEVPENSLEFARMSAGFRHADLSPLHGALLVGAVANQGWMLQPQVLQRVRAVDGRTLFQFEPRRLMKTVERSTARHLTTMMTTTTTQGTARKYFARTSRSLAGVKVAGKTGSLSAKKNGTRYYHSWLVGFAPADKPEIAFASLVVNGPKWRVKGPYIAKKALEKYFALSPTDRAPRVRAAR